MVLHYSYNIYIYIYTYNYCRGWTASTWPSSARRCDSERLRRFPDWDPGLCFPDWQTGIRGHPYQHTLVHSSVVNVVC